MTTARRVLTCPSCNFKTDSVRHFKTCVPVQYWPQALRDSHMAAMHHAEPACECGEPIKDHPLFRDNGWHFATPAAEREFPPERQHISLHEYRQRHPEANPLTDEQRMIMESRTEANGQVVTWERPESLKEALRTVADCERCGRPKIDPLRHIACQPLNGPYVPVPERHDPLKRNGLPEKRRTAKVFTQADVRSGPNWFEALPEADDPLDEDDPELQAFIGGGDVSATTEAWTESLDLRASLIEEQEAEHERREAVSVTPTMNIAAVETPTFACDQCERTFGRAAALGVHRRVHRSK